MVPREKMATQPIIAEKEVNRGFVFALMELQYYDYCSIEFMSSNGMSIEDFSKKCIVKWSARLSPVLKQGTALDYGN